MLLPVGGYSKPEIRQIATTIGLNVAQKKDSQEICFVTQGHHSDFVKAYRGEGAGATAGEFVTLDGHTAAVCTVESCQVRPASSREIPHARELVAR